MRKMHNGVVVNSKKKLDKTRLQWYNYISKKTEGNNDK